MPEFSNGMADKTLIIGSRASKLALIQANFVRDKLKAVYPLLNFEIKTIKTTGDKILDSPLSKIGDKGLFTKEIEEALLKGEIDLAVHSMKDLPVELPKDLKIAAVTKRENPCDVLVSQQGLSLKTLPHGAKIGTSSLRRRAQLLHLRNDLKILDLRGNLDTRIKKLEQGLYAAIMLANAGIKRMGISSGRTINLKQNGADGLKLKLSRISAEIILPQAGQGALGIEIHKDARDVYNLVKALDDIDCHLAVQAERALLLGLEGGCQVPIGVYGRIKNGLVFIKAGVFSLDGKNAVREKITGSKKDAEALGLRLAERILKNKIVRNILAEVRARCQSNRRG